MFLLSRPQWKIGTMIRAILFNTDIRHQKRKNPCPVRCRLFVFSFIHSFGCSLVRGNLNRDPFVAANRMRLQSYLSYHRILVYGIVMLFISSSNVSIQIQHKHTRTHRMMCTIIIVSIDSHVLIHSVCLIGISDVATHSTINTKTLIRNVTKAPAKHVVQCVILWDNLLYRWFKGKHRIQRSSVLCSVRAFV